MATITPSMTTLHHPASPVVQGRILHLQRLSTEDGPGIRTTVFFKGCPLRCSWCHNPESISPHAQVQWFENRCIGCGSCIEACPNHGLSRQPQGLVIDREICTGCGTCAQACPANALEQLGQEISAQALAAELLKDRVYFEKSGGGVTLSGGEPTLQPGFAEALLRELKAAGIHTALDTCGLCAHGTLERLLPLTDLVLLDVKLADNHLHRQYTGQENTLILENLRWLGEQVRQSAGRLRLWVRTPLIPGSTDSPENIQAIGEILSASLADGLERWELCAFNNLCRDKYHRLGLIWYYQETPLYSRADLDRLEFFARQSGIDPQRVSVTGAARVEEARPI